MNQGKAAWYILERSVKVNSDTDDSKITVSCGPTGLSSSLDAYLGAVTACNDLLTKGVAPLSLTAEILLPIDAREQRIKDSRAQIEQVCEKYNVKLISGHTAVTKNVNSVISLLQAAGLKEKSFTCNNAKDIVLINYAAIGGTAVLASDYEKLLSKRFSERIMSEALAMKEEMSIRDVVLKIAEHNDISYMSDVSEGGIFQSLWEMAESLKTGFEVTLDGIPLRQETIEICDYFDINPYELLGTGAVLLVCKDGHQLKSILEEEAFPVSILGELTTDNDKIIIAHGERRFLESKREDALYQVNIEKE